MNLYVVYLGGQPIPGRVGEDHEVVVVVATDVTEARRLAKTRWKGLGKAHVDAVQHVDVLDGHRVTLVPAPTIPDVAPIDPTWEP